MPRSVHPLGMSLFTAVLILCVGFPFAGPGSAAAAGVSTIGLCCDNAPAFTDTAFSNNFTGEMTVVTCSGINPTDFVFGLVNLVGKTSQPLNTNWYAGMYHGPTNNWTVANLGQVFGIAIDGVGNLYATAASCYSNDAYTTYGAGTVYRIDGVTGAVSPLSTLPNVPDPSITPSQAWPGLGNVAYDCVHDQLFVTDFEDGKIYRMDMAGTVLSTFDHGAPDNGKPGFAPLGDRVWGIGVRENRVYYGIWVEDLGRPDTTAANTVWSVALDSGGDFLPATDQLEITLPDVFSSGGYSNPVSDITFSSSGAMLLGERSMVSDSYPSAHASRTLEYVQSGTVWVPSANLFDVGQPPSLVPGCAGGVAYGNCGDVWATGDALHFTSGDYIYGLQNLPATGGDITNSYLIDLNADVSTINKTEIGDVEVPCIPGLCGSKYADQNGDGTKGREEPGLPGWSIHADSPTGERLSARTDGHGTFFMPRVEPGVWHVTEESRPGWKTTQPPGGSYDIDVAAGIVTGGADFGNEPVDSTCCDNYPRYPDQKYSAFFLDGPMAAMTCRAATLTDPVLALVDASPRAGQPLNANWYAYEYIGPSGSWNRQNLGDVFGLCFDASGNIYVTSSTAYNVGSPYFGSSGSPGSIYRIDASTAAISLFAVLPNTGPALGNIAYDWAHDQLFVTNHEDGKIYRLDMSGTVLSTFDHGPPDGGTPGFVPLRDRPWGINVYQDRVYYAIWTEDQARPNPSADNEVWSVGLTVAGDFVVSSDQLEFALPPLPSLQNTSNPVADITFNGAGDMLLGERTMEADTGSSAFHARVLQYTLVSGSWVPSANTFKIGYNDDCASGGVAYDPCGAVWSTGAGIHYDSTGPDYIYGLQLLPPTGGSIANSFLIDADADTASSENKSEIGDVESPCMTALCGMKWEDADRDGTVDPGENGLPGWTVKLTDGGAVNQSTVTDAWGSWYFMPLNAATYTVTEVNQPNWTQTWPAAGDYTVTLGAGDQVTGLDFGNAADTVCCTRPPKGMCAWWPLDDVAPPVVDLIAPAAPGALVDNAAYGPGKVGDGVQLDGAGDYVRVDHKPKLNAGSRFSLDAWIRYQDPLNATQTIAAKMDLGTGPYGRGYWLFLDPAGNLGFQVGDGVTGLAAVSGTALNDGLWHHVALTVGPGTAILYADGAPAYAGGLPGLGWMGNTRPFVMGGGVTGQEWARGTIDEVEFFRRTLPGSEVVDLFEAGEQGKCREAVDVTAVSSCKGNTAKIAVTFCNFTTTSQTYSWSLGPLPAGAGCDVPGPVAFSPGGGVITVPAGVCQTLWPISVTCPSGMNFGDDACYQVTAFHHGEKDTTCALRATGKVHRPGLIWHPAPLDPVLTFRYAGSDTASDSTGTGFEVENTGPGLLRLDYEVEVDDDAGGASGISLNGRDPGQPVAGTLDIPAGSIVPIHIGLLIKGCAPVAIHHLILKMDSDGDGVLDRVSSVALSATGNPVRLDVGQEGGLMPTPLRAYPNPTIAGTHLRFTLARAGTARLRVYDIAGRLVRDLRSGPLEPGVQQMDWDGRNDAGAPVSGGLYFIRLVTAGGEQTAKVLLTR